MTMNPRLMTWLGAALLGVILIFNTLFIVDQREQVVVVRFGDPVRVINEAKGDASKVLQASEGYREQAVRDAQGEAARFNQIYVEYKRAPGVTRDRLYIESMERILARSNKVVIDAKGASAPIILPPDVFRARSQPTPQPQVEVGPSQVEGKAR